MDANIAEKIKFTKGLIAAHITNAYSPEEFVSMELFRKGITEGDFLRMQGRLGIDKPTVVAIANYLRDAWRIKSEGMAAYMRKGA